MSKIGVAVGEDFPLQDLGGLPPDPPEENQAAQDHPSQAESGESCAGRCENQSEFARWRREGQRLWDADVRNERAEWKARKRAIKEKIKTAVRDAVHDNENRRGCAHGEFHRSRAWPKAFADIGLAALAFAIHRRKHKPAPHPSSPPEEPIITPPPPREP